MAKRARYEDQIPILHAVKRVSPLDYLSVLPYDCISDIFVRLDHNDLDETSVLSSRMNGISNLCRAKARKIDAHGVKIKKVNRHKYEFKIYADGERTILKRTASSLNRISKSLAILQGNVVRTRSLSSIDKIALTIHRHNFSIFAFDSMNLNNEFLNFFQRSTRGQLIEMIKFMGNGKVQATRESIIRLLSNIINVKPYSLTLEKKWEKVLIEADFKRGFAVLDSLVSESQRAEFRVLRLNKEQKLIFVSYKEEKRLFSIYGDDDDSTNLTAFINALLQYLSETKF